LVNLLREIVRERGFALPTAVDAFLEAGCQRPQVMELLLGVALKTVSNYLDHLSPTTIDQAFAAEARYELPPRSESQFAPLRLVIGQGSGGRSAEISVPTQDEPSAQQTSRDAICRDRAGLA
jgi:hypothetical protein